MGVLFILILVLFLSGMTVHMVRVGASRDRYYCNFNARSNDCFSTVTGCAHFLNSKMRLASAKAGVRSFDSKDGFDYGVNHADFVVRDGRPHCKVGGQYDCYS